MKNYALVMAAVMAVGCIDCEIICPVNDPGSDGGVEIDTGADAGTDTGASPYSCEYPGPGGACLCTECVDHICDLGDCVYVEDAEQVDLVCPPGHHCRLYCNPYDDPEGCQFSECEGEILPCSRYGWACDEVCPNT
jgi:hypothetical protein